MDKMNLYSKRLHMAVTLDGQEMVNSFGETFLNVTGESLEKAFGLAQDMYEAKLVFNALYISNTKSVFQGYVTDNTGFTPLPEIGEADEGFVAEFWRGLTTMLAYRRMLGRAIIKYLDMDYPNNIYAFCEGVSGEPRKKYLAEQELANEPIPTMEDIKNWAMETREEPAPAKDAEIVAEPEVMEPKTVTVRDPKPAAIFTETSPLTDEDYLLEDAPEPAMHEPIPLDDVVLAPETPAEETSDDLDNFIVRIGKFKEGGKVGPKKMIDIYREDPKWLNYLVNGDVVPQTEIGKKTVAAAKEFLARKEK